jgi:hypothetical protein
MIVALSQRAALSSRESGMNDRCDRRSNGSTARRGAALIERVRKCKKLPDRELREFRREPVKPTRPSQAGSGIGSGKCGGKVGCGEGVFVPAVPPATPARYRVLPVVAIANLVSVATSRASVARVH